MLQRATTGASGGGGETPTLLYSSVSGTTGAITYDATDYSKVIIVAALDQGQPKGLSIVSTNTTYGTALTVPENYGVIWVQISSKTTGITWATNTENARIFAVYGVKTSSFDLSSIESAYNIN